MVRTKGFWFLLEKSLLAGANLLVSAKQLGEALARSGGGRGKVGDGDFP